MPSTERKKDPINEEHENDLERPDVSVVVPVRNEAVRLPAAIETLSQFLKEQDGVEVVLAVDVTSTDGTLALAEGYAGGALRIAPAPGVGKGRAILAGVEAARGQMVVTADTDLAVDPWQFGPLIEHARSGAITIGSRSVPGSRRVDEPLSRFLVGRLFNLVVRTLVLPGISDSQCGFKAFERETGLRLLQNTRALGWVFDVELLAHARREHIPVREVPVVWRYHPGSTLRPLHDAPAIARQLWDVWRRLGRQPERSP